MSNTILLRVLYVGRRAKLVHEICDYLHMPGKVGNQTNPSLLQDGRSGAPAGAVHWECLHVTNQKAALSTTNSVDSPHIVLVETDRHANSRVRFCEILRHRLPNSAIITVSEHPSLSSFAFDGVLTLPFDDQAVADLLYTAWHKSANQQLEVGPIQLDIAKRTVITPNGQYRMTPKQCALLEMLISKHGTVVKRSEIMESIWETSYLEDTRTLDVHVRWLRERIEPDPSNPIYLLTVRGVGYHLQLPQSASSHNIS